MQRIYSSRQVGKLLGADPSSVNRWIDSGKLKAYRTPGGHRRVLHEDLLGFLDETGIPVPEEIQPTQLSILLVDDDEPYLRSLRKALLRLDRDLEVQTCTSGIEALILLGSRRPDAVLLDAAMPGLDGVEVCRRITSSPDTQNVKVIVSAAHPSPATEKRVLEAGAMAYLAKPLKANLLLDHLRETLPTETSE
jgi:excisionase family DNA binding protein